MVTTSLSRSLGWWPAHCAVNTSNPTNLSGPKPDCNETSTLHTYLRICMYVCADLNLCGSGVCISISL